METDVTVTAAAVMVDVTVVGKTPKQLQAELYRTAPEQAEAYVGIRGAVSRFTGLRIVVKTVVTTVDAVTSVVVLVVVVVVVVGIPVELPISRLPFSVVLTPWE
jgi:hypothetical protein